MQIWLRGMFRQIFSLLSVDGVLRISTILRNIRPTDTIFIY